jgi:hypothetical protein
MFEKDAEKYRLDLVSQLREKIQQGYNCKELSDIELAFQKGAEFGYNKANEWHYVKDGDLPNTEFSRVDVTIAYINAYGNPCIRDCCFDGDNFIYWDDRKPIGWKKVDIFGKIYAWKYPEKHPEPPKDGE